MTIAVPDRAGTLDMYGYAQGYYRLPAGVWHPRTHLVTVSSQNTPMSLCLVTHPTGSFLVKVRLRLGLAWLMGMVAP